LSSRGALDRIVQQIEVAVAHGARVICGGKRIARPGAYLEPTILIDVDATNPAYREEFFGPVAIVLTSHDEDEAVRIANDSPFGLGGSIHTPDIARAKRLASRLETGMVFVNYPSISAPELPFGGIKRSGYGTELSSYGIEEFINRKLVCAVKGSSRAGLVG
jgi:succinate-semialdehyde dehydrogenase/glutarate-semialdehyde dehydrogenase